MMEDASKKYGGLGHRQTTMPTPGKTFLYLSIPAYSETFRKIAQSGEILPNMHNGLVSPLPLGTGVDGNNVPGEYSMNERGDVGRFPQRGSKNLPANDD